MSTSSTSSNSSSSGEARKLILEASQRRTGQQLTLMETRPSSVVVVSTHSDQNPPRTSGSPRIDEAIEAGLEIEIQSSTSTPVQLSDPYPFSRN